MSAIFEILDKDAGGRIGRLRTPHGTVEDAYSYACD